MTTYVVGTAGHVDHGKSTLVKAMTGMDPDRLREEKERKLTIDLGFAWMSLADDTQVGIVDVPGHRDFIENMLAGVGGIDAAILVIAADEGVMPQTREHLEILDLLEIPKGLIALTKVDLIQEPDWLDLVEEEIKEALSGTVLAEAPVYRVASLEGRGIEELKDGIARILRDSAAKQTTKRARVPIDRAFSLPGYGTIVTGTLLDGRLEVGDEVQVLPAGLEGRVRGLQTHKQEVELAAPGTRVAVNVSGVDADEVERGDVLAADSSDEPTTLIDAQVRVLPSSPTAIEHNQEVKLFVGADQKMARVRVLAGRQAIFAGESGWIQLMVREPMVVRREDRFILRRPSPPLTLGGGKIVDPHPGRKHRLQDREIADRLEQMLEGSRGDVVLAALDKLGPTTAAAIADHVNLPLDEVQQVMAGLAEQNQIVEMSTAGASGSSYISTSQFQSMVERVKALLAQYHQDFPLRFGMPMEELRSRLGASKESYPALLSNLLNTGAVARRESVAHIASFTPELSEEQKIQTSSLLSSFEQEPFGPPTVKEAKQSVGEDIYSYLLASGQLTEVSQEVVFRTEDYQSLIAIVKQLLEQNDRLTVAELRDHLQTSRKYVLALLEHLDRIGLTVREGDSRRLA